MAGKKQKGGFKRKVSDRQIGDSLTKHRGNITAVARELDVTTATIYRRIKEAPRITARWEDAEEALVDKALGVINDKLEEGDGKTAQWVLDNKGAKRGFGAKQRQLDIAENSTANNFNLLETTDMDTDLKKELLESLKKAREKQLEEGKNSN